jgi:S-adenosylmethionine-diacylglycerol 3-amino-3-carboxypropyl transferase
MKILYNFGISQDDALTENDSLQLKEGDHLLCIASAGEVPLNLLTLKDLRIDAVDISLNQLYLCKLKLAAINALEPSEAASFLGFLDCTSNMRSLYFKKVCEMLDESERHFWFQNYLAVKEGPIRIARFEKYIRFFGKIGLLLIGRKKLLKLLEFETIEDQQIYFDKHLGNQFLKSLFRIAFNPRIYKKHGMAVDGLKHSGKRDIAQFFFDRFRTFCTGTIARSNYFLQFTFFGKILNPEAFPEYLQEKGVANIRKNQSSLTFHQKNITQMLSECKKGEFNKFALSNISDWMSVLDYQKLLGLIIKKANDKSLILSRYIHMDHPIPNDMKMYFKKNEELARKLIAQDRYPFYSLVPMQLKISNEKLIV